MSVLEIANQLVALCREGKNEEAIEKLYSPDIVSVEAMDMPGMGQTQRGIQAITGKTKWWYENHEVHGGEVSDPYPNGNQFIVQFKFDVTPKHTGQRMTMDEVGLYTVDKGKIVKEEFFYQTEGCDGSGA